jgi:lysophospholipase L1-like esterase
MLILVITIIFLLRDKGSLLRTTTPIKSILAVGDSNTVAHFSYADQLQKQLPNLQIKTVAKNGANTSWMKTQLEQELQNNKYDLVIILGGSNDIYGGVKSDVTKSNLDYMYKLSKYKGSKVLAITPPNKDFYTAKTEQKQTLLNDLVNWIKGNTNTDYFIDFHQMTNNKNLFSSADGYLHPQSGAHTILASDIIRQINLA